MKYKGETFTVLDLSEKQIDDIVDGVDLFFTKHKVFVFKCKKCERWLGVYTSKNLVNFLMSFYFTQRKGVICHQCRTHNIVTINHKGKLITLTVKPRPVSIYPIEQ